MLLDILFIAKAFLLFFLDVNTFDKTIVLVSKSLL